MKFSDLIKNGVPNWDAIYAIPEFKELEGCKQNTDWHQEEDVWVHTGLVYNEMAKLTDSPVCLAAALCHDLGKPSTTTFDPKDSNYHCVNHGEVGADIVRDLFSDDPMVDEVAILVQYHMRLHYVLSKPEPFTAVIKLAKESRQIENLFKLYIADCRGSVNNHDDEADIGKIRGLIDSLYVGPQMVILRGLPGSGKSTMAKEWVAQDPTNRVRINMDDLRNMSGPYWVPDRETYIAKIFKAILQIAIEKNKSIVVDNMNLKQHYVDDIKDMTPAHYCIFIKKFDTPLEECIERDSKRERPIGEKVIRELYNKFKNVIYEQESSN